MLCVALREPFFAYIMGTGFHCKVLGYDPFVDRDEAARRGFEKVDTVEELLERRDLVNVNVPLVKSTRNLVSHKAMAHFKPGAVFVNAARGEVIDEDHSTTRWWKAACAPPPAPPIEKLLTKRRKSKSVKSIDFTLLPYPLIPVPDCPRVTLRPCGGNPVG